MADYVTEATVWLCEIELPHSLNLGPITYSTRDYVVLQLRTSRGLIGKAIGYTRFTPIMKAAATLLDSLLPIPITPEPILTRMREQFSPGWGAFVRAASLIDIALWDIRAREAKVPLQKLFGQVDRQLPVMAVAGYFANRRSEREILQELDRFVEDGFKVIKVMLPGLDFTTDLRLVETIAQRLPADRVLAVDAHGILSPGTAVDRVRDLSEFSLLFLEDPFPSREVSKVANLARQTSVAIASGEDVDTPDSYRQLADAGVRYLRLDATTVGGYTSALEGIEGVQGNSIAVLPHVWPHIHAPLSGVSNSRITAIEMIPSYVGADPVDKLLTEEPLIRDGRWQHSNSPGLYLPIDFERVEAFAAHKVVVPSPHG